ncbi:MAG: KaiC domain-containing protein [Candidatus Syntropharchaeia archaeon]
MKEEYDVERVSTGIEGLDSMLGGGFPSKHTVVLIGPFGSGKTIFGLQFLNEGLKNGESGIYISFEEREKELIRTAACNGWDLKPYLNNNRLLIVKLNPADISASIRRIQTNLPDLIRSFGAKRVVIDSVTVLEMLFSDESERRANLFNLCNIIKLAGATALLISEPSMFNPYVSKFGLVEYVADGVILLRYVRQGRLQRSTLALEIVKMRMAKHSRDVKPYDITENGIKVHFEAEIF